MSSHSQVISETTLLLGDSCSPGQSNSILSRERLRFSPETLFIPVALATKLASTLPTTTFLEILRQNICKLWYVSHGYPATLLAGGSVSPKHCDTPDVARYFSTAVAVLAVVDGIVCMLTCGALSRISSCYGRKPAILLVITAGIIGTILMIGSEYMPDRISAWVFIAGMVIELCSGDLPSQYLISMYIVDVCDPKNRTAALNKIAGWATLGSCISYYLGGFITTNTGNPLIVFYVAATLFAATLIYAMFVLPESFSKEKRDALSHMRQELSSDELPPVTVLSSFSLLFEPLKMFVPFRRLDGTRNWRLAWCGLHALLFTTTFIYISTGWFVIATSIYHLTPAQTGFFFSGVTISGAITLTTIVPLLVRLLRPYYTRKTVHSESLLEEEYGNDGTEPETSDHLDVHLAFLSSVAAGVFYLFAAASTTYRALTVSAIGIGFSYVHTPTIRSLVVGSVEPLKQGEALAAIEMVSGIGTVFSPIIMGYILTATINTTPLVLFYVNLVAVLISGGILFLVRDVDRYEKANET